MLSSNKSKVQHPPAESENSKAKLLRAGLEVFSRHGFHGATTKLISQTAGVNEALIMRHFTSKEGLFLGVLAEQKRRAIETLQYQTDDSLEKELVQYGRARMQFSLEHGEFLRMLLSQIIAEDDMADRVKEIMEKEMCGTFVDRLRHFQKRGILDKKLDLDETARMVEGQILIHFIMCSLVHKESQKEIFRQIEFAMRTIARGLQSKIRSN